LAVLALHPAVAQQAPADSAITADSSTPTVTCPNWKPTWETTPLPNGRTAPYLRVPLDPRSLRGCAWSPALTDSLPDVHLFVRSRGHDWTELPVLSIIAGEPPPEAPSARVTWEVPPGGLGDDPHLAVAIRVHSTDNSSSADALLRCELKGRIPSTDQSARGPIEANASGSYVAKQRMLDGSSSAVIHVPLHFGFPTTAPRGSTYARLTTDDRLSTNNNDISTRISVAAGYVHGEKPVDLDCVPNESVSIRLHGNQAGTNQAVGISLGTLLYGRRLNWDARPKIAASIVPEVQFNPLQYEYRYRIDSRLDSAISDQRIFDPSVEVKLAPLYLGLPKGKFATIEDTPNLSLAVKTWWINGRQWEGRYEMRLRVPVHVWFVTSAGISIRHGADEDNNFLSDNSIGFDVGIRRP